MTRVKIWVTNDIRVFIKIWAGGQNNCLSTLSGHLKPFFILNSAKMKSYTSIKLFFYFLYVEQQKQSFGPIFLNRYLFNEKNIFADDSRVETTTILSMEKSIFFETFLLPF